MSERDEALATQRRVDEGRAAALLGSLQLADSFFPGGGYTLSHGLESYAEEGLLDAASLTAIASDLIRHSLGPSDAIALAARVDASIWVADAVLDEAGIIEEVDEGPSEEAKLAEFKRFLDEVDPEDFQS